MICFSLRRQWLLVTFLAVVFFVGNLVLLSRFSDSFQSLVHNVPKTDKKHEAVKLFLEKLDDELPRENSQVGVGKSISKHPETVQFHMNDLNSLTSANGHGTTQKQTVVSSKVNPSKYKSTTAVLVIACNRPSVGRCLDQLIKLKPQEIEIPILVSQDCGHEPTSRVIQSYGKKVKHLRHPHLGDVHDVPPQMRHFMGYYKISRHYKWALSQVFGVSGVDSVVIVEDDLDIAPDFYDYFLATRKLLEEDPTLFCISAWNDNGKEGFVQNNSALYRTDFFPGLGWMLTKKVWKELEPKWPKGFWDDWMRHPDQRKNRACIAPEISRTKTFGRVGVSMGQFFDQYLKFIKLNKDPYPFMTKDLSYLLKKNYDKPFLDKVYESPEVTLSDVLQGIIKDGPVRTTYTSNGEFERAARQIGIMHDLKAGVPRMAYRGIVTFIRNNIRVYLAPQKDWSGYVEN